MQININSRYSTSEATEHASAIGLTAALSFEATYQVSVDDVNWTPLSSTVYWFPANTQIRVPVHVLMYPYFRLVTTAINTIRYITVVKESVSTLALSAPSLTLTDNDALTLSGDATVFEDFTIPATQSRKGANNFPTFNETECAFEFPKNSPTHVLYMIMQMPHKWKIGSTIYPHVHWIQARDETPVFKLVYRWINHGGAVPAWSDPFLMNHLEVPYINEAMGQLSHNDTGIPGLGQELSSIIQFKFYREDSAYDATLYMTSFDVHIEIDSLGSRTELAK